MIRQITTSHPLQSREWGEFRENWGNEILWTEYGLITLHKIPFTQLKIGMFIRGPKPTGQMLVSLHKIAREKHLLFIKLEPFEFADKKTVKLLRAHGCVSGKTLFTPTSFWIDLTKNEEVLMSGFHKKTRYNLRLAQKRGVTVSEDNSDRAFEKYLALMKETVERQGFYAHSARYHKLMWKKLHTEMVKKNQEPIARILTATYKNEIITTWIVFVWKDFLYYPYGASTERHKNLMANNLMMWEAIRYGKQLGLSTFDLWGREEGKGFTKFKEGYNPQVVEFLGTWDLVASPLYWPYRALEFARWQILRAKSRLTPPRF